LCRLGVFTGLYLSETKDQSKKGLETVGEVWMVAHTGPRGRPIVGTTEEKKIRESVGNHTGDIL
jgi:mannose-6-phosphate isomerase class I